MAVPRASGSTPLKPARAALVAVGDELLLGRTVNTNAAWLGRELSVAGVPVTAAWTVADRVDAIQDAVKAAVGEADLVVVTGGLGPTRDDLTREAVAEMLGRPLRVDEELLEALRRRFAARGYPDLPPNNRSQAEVPEGARVLPNPHGTAPGLLLEEGDGLVALLPGVPRELKAIFTRELLPVLRDRLGPRLVPTHVRLIHTTGVPESVLATALEDALPPLPEGMSLAYLPGLRGVDLRFTATGMDESRAQAHFDAMEEAIAPLVAPWRFRGPPGAEDDLAAALLEEARSARVTLATAESCTGGGIGARLTAHAGASEVYRGGVVAYANQAKRDLLGVPEALLREHGAVSRQVAERMAEGAARRLGAEAAVAVTGIAGPGGGSPEKPVGTVWVAARVPGRIEAEHHAFAGDRAAVRTRAEQAALFLLLRILDGRL